MADKGHMSGAMHPVVPWDVTRLYPFPHAGLGTPWHGHDDAARSVLDAAPEAFVAVAADGRITDWNAAAEHMFGYRRVDVLGRSAAMLLAAKDYRRAHSAAAASHARPPYANDGNQPLQLTAVRRSGETFPMEISLWPLPNVDGCAIYAYGRDITERRAREAELLFRLEHDDLTGLPNRAAAVRHMTSVLQRRSPDRGDTAVLVLDLDRFKIIQDSLGLDAGDEMLRIVSQRLVHAVRLGDLVARIADDEFVVVCEAVAGSHEVVAVAQSILDALQAPVVLTGDTVRTDASVGAVIAGSGDESAEGLLRDARAGMYFGRSRDHGQITVLDDGVRRQIRSRLQLERDLANCVDGRQLRLHYQPIVDVGTGRIVGVESLVRWQHPVHGLLAPGAFIDVAEESGMIVPIGAWVLREACHQAQHWRELGCADLSVSVNLSARQFSQSGLVELVVDTMADAGLPHRSQEQDVTLVLEVTETMLMRNPEQTAQTLRELRDLHVQLAIDDFGTGYSSLAYLKAFAVDVVKIDRSFVSNIDHQTHDLAMVEAVTKLGHALDLRVLAEGVETPAQHESLKQVGCDLAQGFHFGRPVPAEQVTDLLLPAAV